MAFPVGQETRLPSGGGGWLLFGFVTHQWELERSPGWPELMGWQSQVLLGTFPLAPGVAATPRADPEHPTAAGNRGWDKHGPKRSLCHRKNGHKSPIMVLTTPRVGGWGL